MSLPNLLNIAMGKIIGIYKITSPANKIYIGQSVNIKRRFSDHKKNIQKDLPKLYNSIKKHGEHTHVFEVIEECNVDKLNERERYWQDFYDVLGDKGLNCKLTNSDDKSGYLSDETRKKISESQKGVLNHRFGKKNINTNKGFKHSEETKLKMSLSSKGKKKSDTMRKRLSISRIGGKNPMFGTISPNARSVVCLSTGLEFNSAREASEYFNINYSTLVWWLNQKKDNRLNLKYK